LLVLPKVPCQYILCVAKFSYQRS